MSNNKHTYGKLIALLLLATVCSCEPPIVFSEPQPTGQGKLDRFPTSYRGTYLCMSDTSLYTIAADIIFQEKTYVFEIDQQEIDTSTTYRRLGDTLFMESYDEYAVLKPLSDSLYQATYVALDTMFVIGTEGVLKKFRGHLILNQKLEEQKWGVWVLSRDNKGVISLLETALPEDIASLEAITPVEDISEEGGRTQYLISPSRASFGKMLKKGNAFFDTCDIFEPVNGKQ